MLNLRTFRFWLILMFLVNVSWSCSENPFKGLQTPAKYSNIKRENVKSDSTQSYALYVPTNYSKNKEYPLILLFDAHANGNLAIEKFKEAAEIFGYILAGSNNAGNGVPNTNAIAENLLKDVSAKYNVNRKRIYTAGFSGGARVAISYALNSGKIKGIIACSAGLTNADPFFLIHKKDIYGIAGFEDFNCREIKDMPQLLKNSTWRHSIDLFDGGHAWPPTAFVRNAVLWHELNAIKDKLAPKNTALINTAWDSIYQSIEQSLKDRRFLLAELKAQSAISFFTSLKDTRKFDDKLSKIRSMPGYTEEMEKESKFRHQEGELQNLYINSFTTKDVSWWKNEIRKLNTELDQNKDLLYRQMLSRVKGFLGIVCFSYTSGAIVNNDLEKAEDYISVYEILEPANPDCFFFKAILLDKKGKPAQSREALAKSMTFGFNDKQKIQRSLSPQVLEEFTEFQVK